MTHPSFPQPLLPLVPADAAHSFAVDQPGGFNVIQISLVILYMCVISSSPRGKRTPSSRLSGGSLPLPVRPQRSAAGGGGGGGGGGWGAGLQRWQQEVKEAK